ncbi:vacuolar protein 8 [Quercus suber]|uniref:Vacuolar protein 8 n=1 Tax=Quercus suber TaxID=58331 RepID=A0AAW0J6U0_QUESU
MANMVREILARPIQLADQVSKAAKEAQCFKQDCLELKAKTDKLAGLLRHTARESKELYERPTCRIIANTQQVLDKALALVNKCRANGILKRVFTIIPAAAFRKTCLQLENCIGDVSWLLRVADRLLGLPPIAANEPILCLIWEQIAVLHNGLSSLEDRVEAAASLVSLAQDNDRYGKLIIEEGGVAALLKLAKEGGSEGQENAARAIGLLGRDPDSVEHLVKAGVCLVFVKILKEGHMKEHEDEGASIKAEMKAMVARALWQLCKGNVAICQNITESRALLWLAVLLEEGHDEVQSYTAMALMEITSVAEQNTELRRSAFKPTSHTAKVVVEKLLNIIEKANSDLLVPCIKSIGNLAKTFRVKETRIVGSLVRLLDESEPEVSVEAAIALSKFASPENYLHVDHCKAIIDAGGAEHLIQLVYFGVQRVQISALVLLCYLAMHLPDSETLAQEKVLTVLEWSSTQAHLIKEPRIEYQLHQAKSRLELYQSRGSREFH